MCTCCGRNKVRKRSERSHYKLKRRCNTILFSAVGIQLACLWAARKLCITSTVVDVLRISTLSFVEGHSGFTNSNIYHHYHRTHATPSSPTKSRGKNTKNDNDCTSTASSNLVVSNVLQRHRTFYNNRLPHNHYLYDLLQVSHNATLQQIQHSYRTLSRIYHPDKTRHRNRQRRSSTGSSSDANDMSQPHISEIDSTIQLQRIRSAYDLLKNDTKRFLYHRHGILHSTQVDIMSILYPQLFQPLLVSTNSILSYDTSSIIALHQWMGYNSHNAEQKESRIFTQTARTDVVDENDEDETKKEERIQNVMLFLIERIRPIIELRSQQQQHSQQPTKENDNASTATSHRQYDFTYYEQYMFHDLIQQCDRIKLLPLGPSILRCIGRAYRFEGRRILRHLPQQKKPKQLERPHHDDIHDLQPQPEDAQQQRYDGINRQHQQQNMVALRRPPASRYLLVMDHIRHGVRHVKHLATATIAGGRVLVHERRQQRDTTAMHKQHDYDNDINDDGVFGDEDDVIETDHAFTETMGTAANDDVAMLESLQIDALWTVFKIELDSIVRQACRRILESISDPNDNVFLPSRTADIIAGSSNYYLHHTHPSTTQQHQTHASSMMHDGWIVSTTTGKRNYMGDEPSMEISHPILTTTVVEQQERVANVLIQMGKILIARSKVGTSWME